MKSNGKILFKRHKKDGIIETCVLKMCEKTVDKNTKL
jgi:hypothetical protein